MTERIGRTSNRFDATIHIRPSIAGGVRNHQRVRIYLGTAEHLGKLTLLGAQETIGPNEWAYCQLSTAEEMLVLRGDRFIVRDETSSRTLGGGIVIAPWANKHRKSESDLLEKLDRLHHGENRDLIPLLIDDDAEFAVPLASLREFLNLTGAEIEKLTANLPGIHRLASEHEECLTTDAKWLRLTELLIALFNLIMSNTRLSRAWIWKKHAPSRHGLCRLRPSDSFLNNSKRKDAFCGARTWRSRRSPRSSAPRTSP